jgi:eukaryotic-like serine/threonine-protein kinase
MIDRVGQQFGNYRLTRLLGRGGFADVYLSQHLRLNMQVAIKVLHTQLNDDDVETFYHEAQIIASLIHPHIVRLLDFDVQDGIPFLVLDYASNDSLRRRHPKGVLVPLPLVVSYVNQVAAALQYAHDQKIIHRDVKPENILVGRQNEILLSDFGLAIIEQSSSLQGIQNIAGTIAYMSPEQIQGHPRLASDQYSLGAVVYEWLCGERLFHGSLAEMTVKHTMVPPRPMREKVPTIMPEVEQVVLMALAKDPKQRFDSVQDFAAALEQGSRVGQPTVSVPSIIASSQPLQPPTTVSSEVEPSQVAVNAVLADVSAQSNETIISPDQAIPPLVPASPGSEFSQVETIASSNETIALSDREKLSPVVVTPSKQALQPSSSLKIQRELEAFHQGISRRNVLVGLGLTGLAAVGGGIAWLVSSRKLVSPSVPDHTFTPLYVYHGHVGPIRTVMWSSDGRRIASGSEDGTVQVWDATNGGNVYTYHGHSSTVYAVAWSPDSKRIASGRGDETVQVWQAV